MNKFVKSDLYRYTGKKTVGAAVKQFFINRAFRIQVFIRLSNGGDTGEDCKSLVLCKSLLLPQYSNQL